MFSHGKATNAVDPFESLQYTWRKKRRLILPRVIKDVTRERLAYWSCYVSAACLSTTVWASVIGWDTVVNRLPYFQLIDGFGGSAMPYVVALGSTMLSVCFFVGSFVCLWATATDYRVKFYRILHIYVLAIIASFIAVSLLLIIVIVHRSMVDRLFQGGMLSMTQRYLKGNELEKQTIDRMQIDTKCCGSSNYTDWLKIGKNTDQVPFSCCNPHYPGPCRFRSLRTTDAAAETVYRSGCTFALRQTFSSKVADGLIAPLAVTFCLIPLLLVPFRYLETSVGSVRDEKRMDSPSIGYLWIKTKRYRVIKGTDEARDKLYEEVEYLDDDSSSSSSSASSEKGDGKVRNANKSNEGTKLAPNANINVSAAPPSNGIADEDMLMSVVRGTSSDQSVTGLQASRSFCDGRSNVRPFFSKEYHQRSHGQPVEDEYSLASDVSRSLRHHAHRPAVERRRRYGGGRHSSPSTLNVSEHVSQLPPGSGSSSATATAVTLHEELRQRQPQQFRQAPISAAKVDFTRKRDEEARFTDEDGSSRSWTTVSYFTLEEPERMRIPTKRTSRHQTKQLQQQQQQQAGLDTPSLSTLHFNRLGSTHSAIKINDVGCRNSEQFPEFHSSASSVKRQLMAPANVVGSRISSGEHLTTLGAIGDGGKSRATVESRDVDDLYRLKSVDNRQQTIDCANTCAADYASSDNISDDMSNSDLSLLTMSNESTKEEDVYYEQVRWHRGGADATTPLLKHHQRSRDNFEMPRREHSSSHGDGGHHRHHVQRLHRDQLQQERLLTQPLDHHPFQRKDANNSSHQRSHRHHHHCSRHDSTDANDMATDYVMHTDAGSRVHRSRLNVIADSNCDQWWNQIPTDDGDKPTMRTKLFDNKAKNYENRSRETRRQPDKCPSASAIHTAEHEQSARMPMSLTLDSRIHRYDVSHGRRGESTTTTTTNDPLMISMQQSGTSNDEEYFDPYVEENLSHTSKATGSCDDDQWRVQFPLPLNVNNNSVIAADVTVTQSGNGLSFIDKGRHNYEFDASRSVARDATETAKTGSRTVGDKDEVAFRRFYRSQSQSSENDRRRPMLQQTDALRRTGVSLLPLVLLPNRPRHRPRGSRDVASVHRSVAEPAAGIGDKRKQQQKPRTTK